MENKLASKFCMYLLDHKIISNDYYDVYVYGLEVIISFFIGFFLILIIGIITGKFIHTVIYLSIFISLRRYTGGYHASTYFSCKVQSVCVYLLTLITSEIFTVALTFYPILGIAGMIIICNFAPIENPNKPLTIAEKQKHRHTSLALYLSILVSGAIAQTHFLKFSNIIFFTLLSIIILMVISIISKKGENTDGTNRSIHRNARI